MAQQEEEKEGTKHASHKHAQERPKKHSAITASRQLCTENVTTAAFSSSMIHYWKLQTAFLLPELCAITRRRRSFFQSSTKLSRVVCHLFLGVFDKDFICRVFIAKMYKVLLARTTTSPKDHGSDKRRIFGAYIRNAPNRPLIANQKGLLSVCSKNRDTLVPIANPTVLPPSANWPTD